MSGNDRRPGFMFTAFGGYDLLPENDEYATPTMDDVAHSLGMLCRFNGHTREFYSVAQHCCNVVTLLEMRGYDADTQLAGLLHDAAEGFVGDIIVPVQRVLDTAPFKKIESKILATIFKDTGLWASTYDAHAVHKADKDMARMEIRLLIRDDHGMVEYKDLEDFPFTCMGPADATSHWEYTYRRIQEDREGAACVT